MSAQTLPELFETLSSGGTFRMRFPSKQDAEVFRRKLATHKFRAERELKLLGMIEHQTLSMHYDDAENVASFKLLEPAARQQPTYEILD